MNIFESFTLLPAKLQPQISIFQHGIDTYQVVKYLIDKNRDRVQNPELIKLAALVHDIGKIEQDWQRDQLIHTKYTRKYLEPLLKDKFFVRLIEERGLKIPEDRELLFRICEEHHNPSPQLIKACKESLLVSMGDVVASILEGGMVGKIDDLLRAYPYTQLNLALVKNLGFEGLDSEIHRIDLPANFVEDVFLANMIFLVLKDEMLKRGLYPLLQKDSTLWIIGYEEEIKRFIDEIKINPQILYDFIFEKNVYETIQTSIPKMTADKLRFILVNEELARRLMIQYIQRIEDVLNHYDYNLSEVIDRFRTEKLEDAIQFLWKQTREKIVKDVGQENLTLPENINLSRSEKLVDKVKCPKCAVVINDFIKSGGKPHKCDEEIVKKIERIGELLKLFDSSHNGYWSITNVYFEFKEMLKEINEKYNVKLNDFIIFDGMYTKQVRKVTNAKLCPICRQFEQKIMAQALITGKPKTDSVYHLYKGSRSNIKVCEWCFLAGYTDLPIARIFKDPPTSQSIEKEKEYLYIKSPLSKRDLQRLIDHASGRKENHASERKEIEEDVGNYISFLEEIGIKGFDKLSVLGLSKNRLGAIKGFSLPSINDFTTLSGVHFPFGSLIQMGGQKVSGSVKKALILATFYDLYHLTRGSLHYGLLGEGLFSIYGKTIDRHEMERANKIYEIASKYARTGFDLNTGLFMLFFDNPRMAANLIFRKMNRSGYALGADKVQEVIDLVEKIAKEDWVFNLGLEITELLIDLGLLPKAKGTWKSTTETYSGVELVKWLQNFKMVRDGNSARNWATRVINGIKRARGMGPNQEEVKRILDLTEKIIQECEKNNMSLSEFSRTIANMDQYLLFYYNQKVAGSEKPEEEK
jgi:hypothetical protein